MTKTIASVYYMPSEAKRSLYQGDFKIPAVAKGEKPFLLEVRDHIQIETEPWFRGTFNGKQLQTRKVITGEEIAADILADWTARNADMTPQCHPGMWIVRDTIALVDEKGNPQYDAMGKQAFRPATDAEKKAMFDEDLAEATRVQSVWDQACIQKGDIMAEKVEQVPFIPEYCKAAARYRGRERKWLHDLTDNDIKTCQYCAKTITMSASVCPNCSNIVDPVRYAQLKQAEQAAMDAVTKGVVRPPVAKNAA